MLTDVPRLLTAQLLLVQMLTVDRWNIDPHRCADVDHRQMFTDVPRLLTAQLVLVQMLTVDRVSRPTSRKTYYTVNSRFSQPQT